MVLPYIMQLTDKSADMSMNIDGTVALITGAASGLGAAAASELHGAGARVAGIDLKFSTNAIEAAGGLQIEADVTSQDQVRAALNRICDEFGSAPAIIVQCAGCAVPGRRVAGPKGPLPEIDFDRVMAVNLKGVFNVMSLSAAMMVRTGIDVDAGEPAERGVIINVSSINAEDGPVGTLPYSCSKAAVQGMTLPAARDLGPFGIRVNCIAPGSFDTPMLRAMPEENVAQLMKLNPFPKRPGHPDEFARLVLHMVENPAINGVNWRIDCGARLAIPS